ncbi:hypothetical protein [Spiroplasma endosymbiont of Polydrusus pterygomalis]|uniref:hypothetical protein n=1 Tax=Spiroplasma endosymbiont of Polydrusus pterygomalis TaxID=3139327 RepID=UPI003CCAC8B2
MKKLLSLLSVLTIGGSAVPTTIAASPYQKEEKLNSKINYLKNKRSINDDLNIEKIEKLLGYNIYFVVFNEKNYNELYLGCVSLGAFIYNLKESKLTKIDGIPNASVWSITFNKNNDVYFATQQGVYLLKSNEKIATKINGTEGDVRWITIDSNNVCHFAIWQRGLFKWENNNLTKYNNISINIVALAIDKDDNLYFGLWANEKIYVFKKGETNPVALDIPAQYVGFIWFNDKDNCVYIGGTNNIYILKDFKIIKHIICDGHVISISVDLNNKMYFSIWEEDDRKGIFVFNQEKNKITKIATPASRSITVDNNDNIYFGTTLLNSGVYIYKDLNKNLKYIINKKEIQINQLKTELEELKLKNDSLIKNNKNEIIDLNLQIKDLKNQLNSKNKELFDFKQNKIKLEQELENFKKSKKDIQNKLNYLLKNKTKSEKDLEIKNIKLNKVFEKTEDNKQKINELTIINGKYIDKVIEYANKIKKLEDQIEKYSDLKEILIESKQNYINLKSENEKLINETKIKINEIENENKQLEKDKQVLKSEIDIILQEKVKFENELKLKTEEIKKLEDNAKLYLLDKKELVNKILEERFNFLNSYEEKNNQIKKQEQENENLKIKIKRLDFLNTITIDLTAEERFN